MSDTSEPECTCKWTRSGTKWDENCYYHRKGGPMYSEISVTRFNAHQIRRAGTPEAEWDRAVGEAFWPCCECCEPRYLTATPVEQPRAYCAVYGTRDIHLARCGIHHQEEAPALPL